MQIMKNRDSVVLMYFYMQLTLSTLPFVWFLNIFELQSSLGILRMTLNLAQNIHNFWHKPNKCNINNLLENSL